MTPGREPGTPADSLHGDTVHRLNAGSKGTRQRAFLFLAREQGLDA